MSTKLASSIASAASSRVLTVRSDKPLQQVAQLLLNRHLSLVVVCDRQGTLIEVVTESDIVRRMLRILAHLRLE